MNISQSPIRLFRAMATYNDIRPYTSRMQAWREAWIVSGARNPIPDILRAVDEALPKYRDGNGRRYMLEILTHELADRTDAEEARRA